MSVSKSSYGKNYARLHERTKFDVLELANNVRNLVAKYVTNDNYVPKKWRYLDGQPALECARALRDQVAYANQINIDTDIPDQNMVQERLRAEEKALRYCNLLQGRLLDIITDCDRATHENMKQISNTLYELFNKMQKWHKVDIERFTPVE